MRDILLITIVSVCAIVSVPRPVFGVMAFFSLSILNLHSMTWGAGQTFPFAAIVSVATIIGLVFSSEPKRLPKAPGIVVFTLLWIVFGISSIFADYPDLAYQKFVSVSKILMMTYVSMVLINTDERLILFLKVIALSMGVHGMKSGIWFVLSGGENTVYGPEFSFLAANNAIGLALAMTIPMLYFLATIESKRWLRWLMFLMIVFSIPAVIGTYSRGAWLGLAFALLLILWQTRYRLLFVGLIIALSIPAAFLMPHRINDRFDDLVHYQEDGSAQQRLTSWKFATHVWLDNPVLGAGFDYYGMEAVGKYYPELWEKWPGRFWSVHSSWFTVLSEHGLLGFLLWILLLAAAIRNVFFLGRMGKMERAPPWLTPFSQMMLSALGAYVISGTFYDAAYFDFMYEVVALTIIGSAIVRRELPEISEPTKRPIGSNRALVES